MNETITTVPLTLLVVWFLTAVAVRLAFVVVARERGSHTREPGSGLPTPQDGTWSVQLAAVTGAVGVVVLAVVLTIGLVTSPLDEQEMSEVASGVADDLDGGTSEEAGLGDDEVLESAVDTGVDEDEVVVQSAAATSSSEPGVVVAAFQLTNAAGEEPRCLEVRWTPQDETATSYEISARVVADLC